MLIRKQIVTASLVLLVSLPLVVPSLWNIQTWYVRHEMEEKLENAELVQVRLHKDSVVWYKAGKEIIVGDALFDVKSWTTEGDAVLFHGLFDHKESQIKKKVEDFSRQQTSSPSGRLFRKYFSSPTLSNTLSAYSLSEPDKRYFVTCVTVQKDLPNKPFISFPSPPPRHRAKIQIL